MSDEDLKSYIKSYYLDRKMTYTKLDKHDRAIGVLLEENKQLKEDKKKVIEMLGEYTHYSTPTEEQNSKNEDIVNNAIEILNERYK